MKSQNVNSTKPIDAIDMPQQTGGVQYGPRNEEERRIFVLVNEALDDDFTEYDSVEALLDDVMSRVDTPSK
jgi:hypothetical protein